MTMNASRALLITLGMAVAAWPQVQTEVPPVVPGAKPAIVEHIQVHGKALEGNLEGDAVDRDVIVFLPPSAIHVETEFLTPARVRALRRLARDHLTLPLSR